MNPGDRVLTPHGCVGLVISVAWSSAIVLCDTCPEGKLVQFPLTSLSPIGWLVE